MNYEEKIAEILEQPCDTCELGDNCDCRVRGIICPYQEKKAGQIKALFPDDLFALLEKMKCKECGGKKTVERSGRKYHCPTCKGTGVKPGYEITVIDTKAEFKTVFEPQD